MTEFNRTPEGSARNKIDKMLINAGWTIQSKTQINLNAGLGIAVREFQTDIGPADYILIVDRIPCGVIEAKREEEGQRLTAHEEQSLDYATAKLKWFNNNKPLPFVYESTGEITHFTDYRDPKPRSREVFSFHKPETLLIWFQQTETLRARLQCLPELDEEGLRLCQSKAIKNLEKSFAQNKPRALIQMATGAGKTFTAITSVYRLLKFAKTKRILFLVDTKNLGEQAEQEFQAFKPNDDKRLFNELYSIQRLRSNFVDPKSQVCISTIQRMYSILKCEELDESAEQKSLYELNEKSFKLKEVVYNNSIPVEFFDFIIVDECHRSIYNIWKQVLDYFDAFIIGLTATPDQRTFGFFQENIVSEYAHKDAVADNVNVDYDIYTIETEITENGSRIRAKEYIDLRNKLTRQKRWQQLDEDYQYRAAQLDRDVVNPSQIRNIIREFKRVIEEELFPDRGEVPKTLIFAKTDSHADDIVQMVRLEFNEGNEFCKKITYNVTDDDPSRVLQRFRNEYNPRIAVTVDMIATGTDVKPIEVLLFMRDVRSRSYFQQMIGRGTRTLNKDDLVKVTPTAKSNKSKFYIIDAVGVFKSIKIDYPPVDCKPSVPLKDLMQMAIMGERSEEVLSTLASRLTRLDKQITEAQKKQFKEHADGKSISDVVKELMNVYDPDCQVEAAKKHFEMSEAEVPNEEQIKEVTNKISLDAVKPFDNPALREYVENVRKSYDQVMDIINLDRIKFSGFDKQAKEKSQEVINNFRKFLDEKKDEIVALKILYSQPYRRKELTYKMIKDLKEILNSAPYYLTPELLWNAYERVEPKKVKGTSTARILTDIISLIRFELKIDSELKPYSDIVNVNFKNWIFARQAKGKIFTDEQVEWLRMIKEHIITSVRMEMSDFEYVPFKDKGGLGKMWKLFGEETQELIEELNGELAA